APRLRAQPHRDDLRGLGRNPAHDHRRSGARVARSSIVRLSHPVDDGGYAEIRESVEHLFDGEGEGPSLSELDDFGIFDMFEAVPDVAVPALFEAQGAQLGTGATIEAFVVHGLRAAGAELPPGEIGLLLEVGDGALGL